MTSGAAGLAIVNPAKLDPDRRDSVCAQCHLTGAARFVRAGAAEGGFRPGSDLSESVAVFVWKPGKLDVSATSHYEALWQSRCKAASGDRVWCGSCHNAHGGPAFAARPEYYRKRCEACHSKEEAPAPVCKAPSRSRLARNNDCTSCHMPASPLATSEHIVFTDHSIPRVPGKRVPAEPWDPALEPFWGTVTERDRAMAHAIAGGEPGRTFDLLRRAAQAAPGDAAVLAQLAEFHFRRGEQGEAAALLERVVEINPANATAAANLGVYRATLNRLPEAVALWKKALQANPGLSGVRVNLAVALYRSGDRAGAAEALREALRFEPALGTAREMLKQLGP